MTDLFLLSRVQMRRIEWYFPLSHGVARVDDRRIVSAIVFVIKNGLRWRDAPRDYGPHKTIYNRFVRWSRLGRVQQDFRRTGGQGRQTGADHDRRHASEGASHRREPFKKGPVPRRIGRTKGGLNSKLHAVCDSWTPARHALKRGADERLQGRGADAARPAQGQELLADKGYDADWFRAALAKRGIAVCIPSKSNRKVAIPYDAVLYNSATKSKTCSGGSKIGGASTPDTTVRPHLLLGNLHRRSRRLLALINES